MANNACLPFAPKEIEGYVDFEEDVYFKCCILSSQDSTLSLKWDQEQEHPLINWIFFFFSFRNSSGNVCLQTVSILLHMPTQ